ncbi:MAG: hypothetical protein L0I03_04270 [Lactococcus lactis]|nr:hypothetical protein [Lactococcus lactis]MDN5441541.1 hypothetical protein [Lactococcus lactis]MDN5464278.1 hypothetical protein [Lactococcus lactis]MDN5470487.1 hypothetical protein [Lactococcus lactis]MDN5487113.1 hypothetical protein [Lactococcus lactis]
MEKKHIKKSDIIEHPSYVKELTRYVISDLNKFRILHGDPTLGGMVICETSEQARQTAACFDEVQTEINTTSSTQSKFSLLNGASVISGSLSIFQKNSSIRYRISPVRFI